MTLDRVAAERAIRAKIADPLGLDVTEAASAIIQVANANMADAVRLISIRRGYDPREFALVVFGGAGALHGAALARELTIPMVLVPPNPGITSALGCLLVDVRHDLATMFLGQADSVDVDEVESEFDALEVEARERLSAEGVPEEQMSLRRFIDMRYLGQWRSMAVPVEAPLDLSAAIARFHTEHEREHSYRRDSAPVEIYRLTLRAMGVTPKPELARHERTGLMPEPVARRAVTFDESESPIETPVYARFEIPAGATLVGPVLLEQLDSTVLIPPDVVAEVDDWLNVIMLIPEAAR